MYVAVSIDTCLGMCICPDVCRSSGASVQGMSDMPPAIPHSRYRGAGERARGRGGAGVRGAERHAHMHVHRHEHELHMTTMHRHVRDTFIYSYMCGRVDRHVSRSENETA